MRYYNIFAKVHLEWVRYDGGACPEEYGLPADAECFVGVQGDPSEPSAWDFGACGVVTDFKCEPLDERRVEVRAIVNDKFAFLSFPADLIVLFDVVEGRIISMKLVERVSYDFELHKFEYALADVEYIDPPEIDFETRVDLEVKRVKGWCVEVPNPLTVSCGGNPFHRASWDFGWGRFDVNHIFVEEDDFGLYNVNAYLYSDFDDDAAVFIEISFVYDSVEDEIAALRGVRYEDGEEEVVAFKQKAAQS